MVLRSHLLHLILYASLISAFFALYWEKEGKNPWVTFGKLMGWMVVGGILFAWVMKLIPG